jgi:hypothetical protein
MVGWNHKDMDYWCWASDGASNLVLVNHGDADVEVAVSGRDVIDGTMVDGSAAIPAGRVRVIAEH